MQKSLTSQSLRRARVRVRGLVQGVGFRPHVFKLAHDLALTGWVRNDGMGVILEVQGERVAEFVTRLAAEKPPLARIDAVETSDLPVDPDERAFTIARSEQTEVTTAIVPDASVCPECLDELLTPGNRRHGYAFLNCTHCGPRYTITRSLPYDRPQTSMAAFPMCAECEREYHDPLDRRFHAQPTACPVCGPQLSDDPKSIVARLRNGEILALKGLGGFHLACDARNQDAVARLRERKNREAKPFAVMVADVAAARTLADMDSAAEELLASRQRPIVLLPRRAADDGLAPGVAPGMRDLGIMLPYTPLHFLIFHEAAGQSPPTQAPEPLVLVMTSANPGGEPLVIDNAEAQERLSGICDHTVDHNRDILIRVDDSVTQIIDGAPAFLRRARSFVPESVPLPHEVPPILAFGADLKNTCCLTRGAEAFVSQHVGDLDNSATYRFLAETAAHLERIVAVRPVAVACDLHPDFLSTRAALARELPCYRIQHHHAHVSAVAVEHGVTGPVLGLSLDGFGLGADHGSWGGELLLVDGVRCERVGHLAPLPQPGGDRAAREPWRMAAAALHALGRSDAIVPRFGQEFPAARSFGLILARNAPLTSSCGRLFDAACGLLGVQLTSAFEGQAPMLLESLVTEPAIHPGGFTISGGNVLDFLPLLGRLADGMPPRDGAELFHGTLTAGLVEWVSATARRLNVREVALTGGCLLNRVLAHGLLAGLRAAGLLPLYPRRLPPNDGAISLGQAWIAALMLSAE